MPGATAAQVRGYIVRIAQPCVLYEAGLAVSLLDGAADAVLQVREVIADEVDVRNRAVRDVHAAILSGAFGRA